MNRVVNRFRARRVAARFQNRFAMSLSDAATLLGVSVSASPEEVNKAYRKKFIENRSIHPDSGGDATVARDLNIAKDTLLGLLRPDRGTPQRPSPPPPPVERDPEPDFDYPIPEGVSYAEAISKGGFQWYLGAYAGFTTDYARVDPDKATTTYAIVQSSKILLGKNSSHYAILKITRVIHKRNVLSNDPKAQASWRALITTFPNQEKFLKVAPKVIKELAGHTRQMKYYVFENHRPTEDALDKVSKGRLTLKDALLGSGLVSVSEDKALDNRKIQVELEPVFSDERYKNRTPDQRPVKTEFQYDWHLYFNGRKVKTLDQGEVERLSKKHVLLSLYDYDYDRGKKNLTRLKGGRFKYDAKTALKLLAEALNPGPEKETLEKLSESM